MSHVDRASTLELLSRLAATPIGEHLILGGSSGLHAASERLPALTEDVDLVIDADWVKANAEALLSEMRELGFEHLEGTCSLMTAEGQSVDLVGYSRLDTIDRIGGTERLPVMVFSDLSVLMASPEATMRAPGGGRALTPAALAVSKLLTIRLEKGSKDKLQALLIIEENLEDEAFAASLARLLGRFDRERILDAVADAQAALLTISTDSLVADPQAIGYAELREAVARGLEALTRIIGADSKR